MIILVRYIRAFRILADDHLRPGFIAFLFETLQAQASLAESSRKLDLLRLSLELRRQELPPDSGTAAQLKRELASVQSASPVPVTYTSLQPFRGPLEGRATVPASVSRCAAVTGQLEVQTISI